MSITPQKSCLKKKKIGLPGSAVVKNPPAKAGDRGLNPGPENPTCPGATKPVHHNY